MTGTDEPIFLHSMWRTGSSYLLSRFAAEERYLAFYEPFNGEIGSHRLRRKARQDYATRREQLRHPDAGDGYFAIYDEQDPASGRPLWRLARPSLPVFDVYNGLSAEGAAMIEACIRLARQQGRTPVLGFCHSGMQIGQMRTRFGGQHIYLSRAPREQFLSYDPQGNDFFMTATALQLLCSAHLRERAVDLVPELRFVPRTALSPLVRMAPHWLTMRIGRPLWRRLDLPALYRLFYLSWCASHDEARAHCHESVSLADLDAHADMRSRFEARYAITFDGLGVRTGDSDLLDIDFPAIEAELAASSAVKRNQHDGHYQLSA